MIGCSSYDVSDRSGKFGHYPMRHSIFALREISRYSLILKRAAHDFVAVILDPHAEVKLLFKLQNFRNLNNLKPSGSLVLIV